LAIYLLCTGQIFYRVQPEQYLGHDLDECYSIPCSDRDVALHHHLDLHLVWDSGLRNTKKHTELTAKLLPVHSKSNIKLYTSICLSFMCITCKISTANLKLIDNLIGSCDTWSVSMARYAD